MSRRAPPPPTGPAAWRLTNPDYDDTPNPGPFLMRCADGKVREVVSVDGGRLWDADQMGKQGEK